MSDWKLGGNLDDEQKLALVHLRVDLGRADVHRRAGTSDALSPSAIRREMSEPSSSTISTERLVASVTAPVATVFTEMLKA